MFFFCFLFICFAVTISVDILGFFSVWFSVIKMILMGLTTVMFMYIIVVFITVNKGLKKIAKSKIMRK